MLKGLQLGVTTPRWPSNDPSYHLQQCRLPKLDAKGAPSGGHNSKMAFKPSYHLQLGWLLRLDPEGVYVGGYPSLMLKGRRVAIKQAGD